MSALNTLQFSGYVLRPAGRDDLKLAEQWTAWDRDHAGQIDPAFWLEQRPGVDSVLVLDGKGPVFFFKTALYVAPRKVPHDLALAMRAQVFIQFMPCATEEDRERTREALIQGATWFESVLKQQGAEEIFFDSRNEKLITFCIKRLRFECVSDFSKWFKRQMDGDQTLLRLRKQLKVAT